MPEFTAKFHRLLQDSQELGSNDEHMVSRVLFTLELDGKNVGDYTADLKQAVGSEFNEANVEVGTPNGYEGEFNYLGFSAAVRTYFSETIGPQGRGVRIQGNPKEIRMRNNTFNREFEAKF